MRVLVDKSHFLHELSTLRSIYGDKESSNPNLHIGAADGSVTLKANDGGSIVFGTVAAKVVDEGSLYIKGAALLSLMKLLPNGELVLQSTESGYLSIAVGEFSAILPAAESKTEEDDIVNLDKTMTLSSADFLRLIDETSFIVSKGAETSMTKYALLEVAPDAARMVTTDGHRLAIATVGVLPEATDRLILMRRSVTHLKAILANYKGQVVTNYTSNAIKFSAGDRWFFTKLATGVNFPPYQRVMPKEAVIVATVSGDAVRQAVKRVTLMSEKLEDCPVIVQFTSPTEIQVEARNTAEGDSAVETVDATVEVTEGELPSRYQFKARYIIDALNAVGETVRIQVPKNHQMPAGIQTDGKLDQGIQIVMPQEIKEKKAKNESKAA